MRPRCWPGEELKNPNRRIVPLIVFVFVIVFVMLSTFCAKDLCTLPAAYLVQAIAEILQPAKTAGFRMTNFPDCGS